MKRLYLGLLTLSWIDPTSSFSLAENHRSFPCSSNRLTLGRRDRNDDVCCFSSDSSNEEQQESELENRLIYIAQRLKLEVFDLDEGVYGFDSQDPMYGLEVIQTEISLKTKSDGLGLVLTELAGNADGRGLVLISEVAGNAAKASFPIHVGDVITGIRTTDGKFQARTTGLNYEGTVEVIGLAKEAATGPQGDGILSLQLNRLVKRATIVVQVQDEKGDFATTIEARAGENLRRLLLRKGVKLYDRRTKRFDMPYATGDCAGEGLCGTCLVAIKSSSSNDCLNPKDNLEALITKGRPMSWRASCRTVVGANNQDASLCIQVKPQSQFSDEINPGVKSISNNNAS
ncbi:hypothetical protein ACA910_015216 [Epithemia clementina (nom. ined.)]